MGRVGKVVKVGKVKRIGSNERGRKSGDENKEWHRPLQKISASVCCQRSCCNFASEFSTLLFSPNPVFPPFFGQWKSLKQQDLTTNLVLLNVTANRFDEPKSEGNSRANRIRSGNWRWLNDRATGKCGKNLLSSSFYRSSL